MQLMVRFASTWPYAVSVTCLLEHSTCTPELQNGGKNQVVFPYLENLGIPPSPFAMPGLNIAPILTVKRMSRPDFLGGMHLAAG
jgi:hypothetical protein